MNTLTTDRHNYALDMLRILACIFVVLTHVSCYGLVDPKIQAPSTIFDINEYQIYNLCCCLTHSAVIIFIMISGSFLLDPNIELKPSKLKMHIVKIIKLFFVFSLFGIVCEALFASYFGEYSFNISNILRELVEGEGHLWYLYMILGLYIITPILRVISKNEFVLNEFVVIGIFVCVIVESINVLYHCELLSSIIDKLHLDFVAGYTTFYFLGYKLKIICEKYSKYHNVKTIVVFLLIYILSVLVTYYLSAYDRIIDNVPKNSPYYSLFFITNVMEAMSLFFIALIIEKIYVIKNKTIIKKMSSYTTGIYCIHYYVISYLLRFNDFDFVAPIRILVLSIIAIIISVIVTFVLKKIPITKDIL